MDNDPEFKAHWWHQSLGEGLIETEKGRCGFNHHRPELSKNGYFTAALTIAEDVLNIPSMPPASTMVSSTRIFVLLRILPAVQL